MTPGRKKRKLTNSTIQTGETPVPLQKGTSLPLPTSRPHVLQVSITLGKTVERVVALATGTHEAAKCVALVLAGCAAVVVDLCDGDLHRAVVVGLDDTVGCAALAGDVPIQLVFHGQDLQMGGFNSIRTSPRSLHVRSPF